MRKIAILLALFLASPASAQIVNTLPFQLQNGTTADATQVMADFNQIVNNANSNAAKNGANSDITSLSGLTTPLSPAQGGSSVYVGGTSGGAANAQTVTPTPNGFTLAAGKRIVFIAGFTNTGPTTLSVSGSTATNVFYPTPSGPLPLVGGEIVSGNIIEAWFDGTQYQLITNNLALLGPLTNIASAATTDLGTVPTHNVNITGNTGPITSFGSTASTAYPIYYLTFVSTPTITYNAASMITPGKADIVVQAGDSSVVQYLGSGNWKIWSYQRATGANVVATTPLCGGIGVVNKTTGNTGLSYAADSVVMVNGAVSVTRTGVSGSINATNVGVVNGTQVSLANNQFYDIYFIDNGTAAGGFLVPEGTSASFPSGYVYSCLLGTIKTNGSANFLGMTQTGSVAQYKSGGTNLTSLPVVVFATATGGAQCNSNSATPTWVPLVVSGNSGAAPLWAPSIATDVQLVLASSANGATGYICVAPNSAYGGAQTQNPSPLLSIAATGAVSTGWIKLETSTIYYAADSGNPTLFMLAYKMKINAN